MGAQTFGSDGNVHGNVSAADYNNIRTGSVKNIIIYVNQEFQAEPCEFFACKPDQRTFPCACIQHYAVADFINFIQSNVCAYITAAAECDTHIFKNRDEFSYDILWKPVCRNRIGKAAARFFLFLIYGNCKATLAEIESGGQARRTGTYDGNFLSVFFLRSLHKVLGMLQDHISKVTLNAAYIQALIICIAVAAFHTEVSAYAAGNSRHRIYLQDYAGRILISSCTYHFHICGDVCMGWAVSGTWSLTYLCCTENGVITVFTHHSGAEMAALTCTVNLSAQNIRIAVIPAANVLTQVSGYGSSISDVRSGNTCSGSA